MVTEQLQTKEQDTSMQLKETQLEFAQFQHQQMQLLMQRADSKSQFIVTANAVLISVMALLFADIRGVFLVRGVPILIAYVGLLIPFVATNLVSMVQAFLVVYPLFASPSQGLPCASLLYFREIIRVHKNADEYNQSLSNASLQGMLENATADIYLHCLGAARKYELLRSSTKWLIVSAVIWVLALAGTLLLS